VRPGGLIAGDDYRLDGWWQDGVVRAVNEFVGRHELIIDGVFGSQFILRKL